MLTTQAPRAVSTHGVGETTQFSIKANGKAFKVLIDGLYSDKIRAVVRELWTNAFDAHAMAGNTDVPFDCHLPTMFDPVFRVRDYGIGMSHEQIMRLYTTVFESSKEDTNSQVGKLGLGSKSPFAYTDTFTVTSYTGTEKRSYSAYIGSDHIPCLAVMGVEPCDEPRGIEISFPTKPGDVGAFSRAAEQTILGFTVPPSISGTKINVPELTVITSGDDWKLVSGAPWGTAAFARQGCVVYPIDWRAIPNLTNVQAGLLQSSLFIDFPIGQLEISASRESLGYDEPTKANIKAAVERIEKEIAARFQADIDQAPTMWGAAIRLRKVTKGLSDVVRSVVVKNVSWRGRPIEQSKALHSILAKLGTRADQTFESGGIRTMMIHGSTLTKGRNYGRRAGIKWEPSSYGNVILGNTHIVIEDADVKVSMPVARLRHWYDANGGDCDVLWVKGSLKSSSVARFLAVLGRPDSVHYLAKMDRPPVDKTASVRTKVQMRSMAFGKSRFEAATVNEEDENIYVDLHRNHVCGPSYDVDKNCVRTDSDVNNARALLIKLGYMQPDTAIVGVPATHKGVPARNAETWTCLWDLVERAVDEHFDEAEAAKARAYYDLSKERDAIAILMRSLVADAKFGGFDHKGPATNALAFWANVILEAEKLSTINDALSLAHIYKGEYPVNKTVSVTYKKEHDAFKKAYPLIEANLNSYSAPDKKVTKTIVEYVNLVDATSAKGHSAKQDDSLAA